MGLVPRFPRPPELPGWPALWPGLADLGWGPSLPAVDVFERDGRLVVTAELPGVAPEDIDLRIHEDRLTIRAESRHEEGVEEDGYLRMERRHGSVSRTVPLPRRVDPTGARATFRRGVLRVELPLRGEDGEGRRLLVEDEA